MGVGIDVVLVMFDDAVDYIELVTLIDLDEPETVEVEVVEYFYFMYCRSRVPASEVLSAPVL